MNTASKILFLLLLLPEFYSSGQTITPMMEKVYAMNEMVSDPERQVGSFNPDSTASLPIGIVKSVGDYEVIIAIDSAYFLPDGAYFNAYMAMDFPGADTRLAFAAKNIKFNPKGIIGGSQSKLQLVSEHLISVGPNTRLLLPADGSNFVNWSCNGFESVNLHGFFLLDGDLISPPEESVDTVVTAEFDVLVQDIHNMMAMVDFSPFVIKGMEDCAFEVSDAIVDMSDYSNPQMAALPACYHETYAQNINLWRGFYLQNFSVTLPEELSKSENRVTLYAQNMFIDDAGVTGNFGGTNLFTTDENAMNGEWGFSLEALQVGLTLNKITQGSMSGEIVIPPMDNNTLEYTAMIGQNESTRSVDYLFSISPSGNMSMSPFNSTLTIDAASTLTVAKINRKFKPQLKLHGLWKLDNSSWKFQGIAFQNFTLVTESPFVTGGYFSLITENNEPKEVGGFPISFSNIGFGIINTQPVIGADIALNLGDESSNSLSVTTGVKVYAKITQNSTTHKHQWQYDKVAVNTIHIDLQTSAINLEGLINYYNDNPVYGKGFYGGLNILIPSVMNNSLGMSCAFGRKDGYRYWMVDASLPVDIPLGPTMMLNRITGGAAYHMTNTQTQQQLIGSVAQVEAPNTSLSPNYIPNQNQGLIFKAGVGFKNRIKEDGLNGDAMFTITFNGNGGLQDINLSGNAYLMCTAESRKTDNNYAHGQVNINYDNQQKIFDAQLVLAANFSGALTANIWSQIYISPVLWFVHLGKPSLPCNVNVLNLAQANAYFMFGQSLEPMPQPPPQVSSVLGTINDQRNESSIATGDGIACGMNLTASFSKTVAITDEINVYGMGGAGLGFDMTLYKYSSTTHCAGSSEPFGANYWYLQGQLYAYMGLDIGVAKSDNWDFKIIQGNAAMLLQGKMPNPSYVYGGIYLQAAVLGLINVDMTLDFDFGNNCTIVN